MSTATAVEVVPTGRDSKSQPFFASLNELVGHLRQFLESGEGTISEECRKMTEEAFESLEKFGLDGTFEQIASIIATAPEILQVFNSFMSKVSSGL